MVRLVGGQCGKGRERGQWGGGGGSGGGGNANVVGILSSGQPD